MDRVMEAVHPRAPRTNGGERDDHETVTGALLQSLSPEELTLAAQSLSKDGQTNGIHHK
jgi:hypothetical protein